MTAAAEGFALGDSVAKSLVHLLAESCVKQVGTERRPPSPFRLVDNDARARYEDKAHDEECPPCGPPGKPAQPGSPWSAKHQQMASLRLVGKAILMELWREAGGSEQKRPCGECGALIPTAVRSLRNAAHGEECSMCVPGADLVAAYDENHSHLRRRNGR